MTDQASSLSLARAGLAARSGVDKVLPVLQRLVPIAKRLSLVVRIYAAMSAVAALMIVAAGLVLGPEGWGQWLVVLLVAAIQLVPFALLWVFASALDEAVALPGRIRENPDLMKGHAGEVAELVRESQARARDRRWLIGLPGDVWRAGKLLISTHKDLPEYGKAIRLISIPFLFATALAAGMALFQIFTAPIVLFLAALLA